MWLVEELGESRRKKTIVNGAGQRRNTSLVL